MARRDKKGEREIARERVSTLVALADAAIRTSHVERAHRYAELAWRVKTKYQLRRTGIEPRICRACFAFLAPGSTARVRLTRGKRTTTCLRCGNVRRHAITSARSRPGAPAAPRGAPRAPTRGPPP